MILNEAINMRIREIIDLLLEHPGYTIKAKQNAPRPQGSYADVEVVSDTSIGWEQIKTSDRDEDEDINFESQGMGEVLVSIRFYRDNSSDNARFIRSAIVRETIQSLFIESKIGLTRRSDVRDLSETLESGWEEGSQLDLYLSVVGSDLYIVNSILSLNMSVEYQARGLKYNFEIEV